MGRRLQGKAALVTGAGQGIGRGIAVRLAQEGARVAIADLRDDASSQQTLTEVRDAGSEGCVLAADVAEVEAVRRLVGEADERLGRLDVLVNNAGIEHRAAFLDVAEADYDHVLS
jgi:glucose 1-dehydrogenase